MQSRDEHAYVALLRDYIENTDDPPPGVDVIAAQDAFDISLIGINESRVDATVRSDGREWRVVFGAADAASIEWISVFERPAAFEGIAGGRIVVINGPSGSGKSATLHAIAQHDARPWIVFDEPHFGIVAQPYLIWRDTAPTVHRGFLDGVAAVARAGNLVAAAAAGHPMSEFERSCGSTPRLMVGLRCDLETLVDRERGRDGRWGGLAASSMNVHDGWTYDLEFDTSSASPGDIAVAIVRALE